MTTDALPTTSREVRLASRPTGPIDEHTLAIAEVDLPALGDGDVLVRNEFTLLASVYRDLMDADAGLVIPSFEIDQPLYGRTVGTVLASNAPGLAVGDLVDHFSGFREFVAGPAQQFTRVDRDRLPSPDHFLANGPTAYQGMVDVANVGEGDVVFVSGATTGVGSIAGQIAKCRGAAKVIGSTGSKGKIDYLVDELGFDAAFDYHDGPVAEQLREHAPDGVSVFFDNVGGEQFEAAVQVAQPFARFALCGALSGQGGASAGGAPPLSLLTAIGKQLTIRGFACFHTPEQIETWNAHFAQWLDEGRFVYPRTIVPGGVPAAPAALAALFDRQYTGNVVLALQQD